MVLYECTLQCVHSNPAVITLSWSYHDISPSTFRIQIISFTFAIWQHFSNNLYYHVDVVLINSDLFSYSHNFHFNFDCTTRRARKKGHYAPRNTFLFILSTSFFNESSSALTSTIYINTEKGFQRSYFS